MSNTDNKKTDNKKIDISIEKISITFTDNAARQIILIKENDFTLEDQVFRLKIDGKGCQGFEYAIGFTSTDADDLVYKVHNVKVSLHLDPFTAYYCQQGVIDFISDFSQDTEGFHFENTHEKNYRGKFFKDESKAPLLKQTE